MKTTQNFLFTPTDKEYIIRLKSKRFPWWIFLFLLLLLILIIPLKTKIEFNVVEKSSLIPIKQAIVTLTYDKNEKSSALQEKSDTTGYVVFKLKDRRIYQIIFGIKSKITNITVKAEKSDYNPDFIKTEIITELTDKPKDNILKLYKDEVAKKDDAPYIPKKGCQAFFTGLVVGGEFEDSNISEIYKVDNYSEFVGYGEYADNEIAFPKAVASTFDGIAIDSGTRVIIYEEKDFKGKILLDKTGPAVINNMIWKNDSRYTHCNTDTYKEPLQSNFPQSVRIWSETDMQAWSYGSLKVICN